MTAALPAAHASPCMSAALQGRRAAPGAAERKSAPFAAMHPRCWSRTGQAGAITGAGYPTSGDTLTAENYGTWAPGKGYAPTQECRRATQLDTLRRTVERDG